MKKIILFFMLGIVGKNHVYAQFQNAVPAGTPYLGFTHLGTNGNNLEERRFNSDNAIATSVKTMMAPGNVTNSAWVTTADSKIKYKRFVFTNGTNSGNTIISESNEPNVAASTQRLVVIRPNDDQPRPCIFITPGGAFINLVAPSLYYFMAADFAAKGYVAVFYEYRTGWTGGTLDFEKASYKALQDAIAAVQYTISVPEIKALPNQLFAMGESAGGITTLHLGLADANNSFMGPNFSGGALGNFTSRSLYPSASFNMSAIMPWAGALEETVLRTGCSAAQTGTLLDAADASTRVWFFHGSKDPLVNPNNGSIALSLFNSTDPLLGGGRSGTICTNGPLALKTRMDALGIPNRTIMVCEGGHGVWVDSPPNNLFALFFITRQMFDLIDYVSWAAYLNINAQPLPTVANNLFSVYPQSNLLVNNPPYGYMVLAQACSYIQSAYAPAVNGNYLTGVSLQDLAAVPDQMAEFETWGDTKNKTVVPDVSVYPNPTEGRIVLECPTAFTHIQVLDMMGRQQLSIQTGSVNRAEIDLGPLPSGIYLIQTDHGVSQKVLKR